MKEVKKKINETEISFNRIKENHKNDSNYDDILKLLDDIELGIIKDRMDNIEKYHIETNNNLDKFNFKINIVYLLIVIVMIIQLIMYILFMITMLNFSNSINDLINIFNEYLLSGE